MTWVCARSHRPPDPAFLDAESNMRTAWFMISNTDGEVYVGGRTNDLMGNFVVRLSSGDAALEIPFVNGGVVGVIDWDGTGTARGPVDEWLNLPQLRLLAATGGQPLAGEEILLDVTGMGSASCLPDGGWPQRVVTGGDGTASVPPCRMGTRAGSFVLEAQRAASPWEGASLAVEATSGAVAHLTAVFIEPVMPNATITVVVVARDVYDNPVADAELWMTVPATEPTCTLVDPRMRFFSPDTYVGDCVALPQGGPFNVHVADIAGAAQLDVPVVVLPIPLVTGVSPRVGTCGTRVSLTGAKLGATTEVGYQNVGRSEWWLTRLVSVSDHSIDVDLRCARYGSGVFLVRTPGFTGPSLDSLEYRTDRDLLSRITPPSGPPGTAFLLEGPGVECLTALDVMPWGAVDTRDRVAVPTSHVDAGVQFSVGLDAGPGQYQLFVVTAAGAFVPDAGFIITP